MELFGALIKKYQARKFRQRNLLIIQEVPGQCFERILVEHEQAGWEIVDNYQSFSEQKKKWNCKLRKGQTILVCQWLTDKGGSLTGPVRVVKGIAATYQLKATDSPH